MFVLYTNAINKLEHSLLARERRDDGGRTISCALMDASGKGAFRLFCAFYGSTTQHWMEQIDLGAAIVDVDDE